MVTVCCVQVAAELWIAGAACCEGYAMAGLLELRQADEVFICPLCDYAVGGSQ